MMWSASAIARKWTWALVSRHWYPQLTLYRLSDVDIHLEDTHTLCIGSARWTFFWRTHIHSVSAQWRGLSFGGHTYTLYRFRDKDIHLEDTHTLCIGSATWTFIWRTQFIYNYTLCNGSATWTLGNTQFSRKQYSQFTPGCIGSMTWILVWRRHSVRKSNIDKSLCINQWLTWTFIWRRQNLFPEAAQRHGHWGTQSIPGSDITNSLYIGSATLYLSTSEELKNSSRLVT